MSDLLTTYLGQVNDFRDEIARTQKLMKDTYDLIAAEVVATSDIRLIHPDAQPVASRSHGESAVSWSFTGGYVATVIGVHVTIWHDERRVVAIRGQGHAITLDDISDVMQAAAVLSIIAATLTHRVQRDESNAWYEAAIYDLVSVSQNHSGTI